MTTSSPALPTAPSPSPAPTTPAKSVKPAAVATKAPAKTAGVAKQPQKAATKPASASKKKASTTTQVTPKLAKSPAAPAAARDTKAKKPKLVRDSFTIPKDEYAVIETLKQRSAALAQPVKKSELLRAGLKVLAAMSDAALRSAVQAVPSIKTGRPKAEAAPAVPAPATKTSTKASRK